MRGAAGLDAVLDEEQVELLRFVTRMAAAAETGAGRKPALDRDARAIHAHCGG